MKGKKSEGKIFAVGGMLLEIWYIHLCGKKIA